MFHMAESDLCRIAFARFIAATKYLACMASNCTSVLPGRLSGVFAWIHIALFLAFSGLAPGTMPELRAGGLTIVICHGAGLSTVTLDENGIPVESLHEPCEWSVHTQAVGISTPCPEPAIAVFHDFRPESAKSVVAVRQHWSGQNRPRGPPKVL